MIGVVVHSKPNGPEVPLREGHRLGGEEMKDLMIEIDREKRNEEMTEMPEMLLDPGKTLLMIGDQRLLRDDRFLLNLKAGVDTKEKSRQDEIDLLMDSKIESMITWTGDRW